ncbi:F-box only protein 21-like [Anoplolepis gracilipes]|uniref:F-box only protein 21-like n=1 Tax=Anoplolepis gracilipes TaxID=354296 RepID=UPI003BA26D69
MTRRLGIRCVLKKEEIGEDILYYRIAIIWTPKYDNTENLSNADFFIVKGYQGFIDRYDIVTGRYTSLSRKDLSSYVEVIGFLIHEYIFYITEIDEKYPWELNIIRAIIENESINITGPIKVRSDIVRTKPKIRNKEIKFAIGMIVKHRRINSSPEIDRLHFGVIIDWHFKCEAVSMDISNYMNFIYLDEYDENENICIHRCKQLNQAHYIILTENDKLCYIAQDDMLICVPQWIDNIEIGRHFSRFEGTHYVPNKSLAEEYPNDIGAVPKILFNIS